jgi:hypothetical protein
MPVAIQKKVVGLDITVNDTGCMRCAEDARHGATDAYDFSRRQ